MSLSPHFTLAEMTASSHAVYNKPGEKEIIALTALCENILEPVREKFGPVTILSGFRSPELNKTVGGASTSQHVKGEAADITVKGVDNIDVWQFIKDNLNYDQLIAEKLHKDDGRCGWIHVSYSKHQERGEALSFLGAGKYVKGLQYV